MDVNETLRALREKMPYARDAENVTYPEDLLKEIARLFDGLDEWLSNRGFAPEPWRRIEPRLADMERRAYRLRCALREAGVPENLVRAVELGGDVAKEEERARALARGALAEAGVPIRMIRTEEERRQGPRGGDL